MARYIEISTKIYQTYLKYFAPEDMHVYSIDEIFIDITHYMKIYQMSARKLTQKIIQDIQNTHGLTAAAGIGTNLYLCKIAMDIVAKHVEPDENGVRIAQLFIPCGGIDSGFLAKFSESEDLIRYFVVILFAVGFLD